MLNKITEYIKLTQDIINGQESQLQGLRKTASETSKPILVSADIVETSDILKEAGFNKQSKDLTALAEEDPNILLSCINKLASHVIRMDSREEPNVFGSAADDLSGQLNSDADVQFDSTIIHIR